MRTSKGGNSNPFVLPGEKIQRVEGLAASLDCSGKGARFSVKVGEKVLSFDMPDPDRIQLRHNNDATFDFTCGPQKPFPVAIEFVPGIGPPGTVGSSRKIEF